MMRSRVDGRTPPGAALQLKKGAAVFAYANALQQLSRSYGDDASQLLSEARAAVDAARLVMPNDPDLAEIDRITAALGG